MPGKLIPWDGPLPSPGDYMATATARHTGIVLELTAVTPLRQADENGNRLDIRYRMTARASVPEHAVIHPFPRYAPADPAGPARVRQVAESGPTAVMRDSWRDPTDANPNARTPKEIRGYRTFCALRRMQAQSGVSSQITEEHVLAADAFRTTVDLALIGWSGARDGTPIQAIRYGPRDGFSAGAVSQAKAWQDMTRALARFTVRAHAMLDAIILRNMSIKAWCEADSGGKRQRNLEMGRLLEILDILAEHFADAVERAQRAERVSAA